MHIKHLFKNENIVWIIELFFQNDRLNNGVANFRSW